LGIAFFANAVLVLGTAFFANPALVLGTAFFANAALVLGTAFFANPALVLGNAAFLTAGFLAKVSFLVLGNAVFWVLDCGCFLVLVDFLLVGLEVLAIFFLDFSVLNLGRLFAYIANLLILE